MIRGDSDTDSRRLRRQVVRWRTVALVATGCAAATVIVGVWLAVGGGGGEAPAPSTGAGASPPPTSAAASPSPSDSAAASSAPSPLSSAVVDRTPVPILMYHLVAVTPHDAPYPDLYVSPMAFADQLRYLKTHGYHPLTLRRVYDCWHGAGELPDKPVVLSFDDGYLCDYTIVAPLLADYRWPGVLNLTARTISPGGDLTPDQVKVLLRLGWEIDAHSMDHADLTTLTAGQLETEVSGARTVLRTQLHAPVDFFCYPSGRYDDTVVAEVQAAGYLGATTTVAGLATPDQPFELRRQRVDSQMTLDAFGALLSP